MATSNLQIPYLGQNVLSPEIPENEAKDILDAAICGQAVIPMQDADYTLKLTNQDNTATYPHEWQYGILIINDISTASRNLNLPDTYKMKYVIENNSGQNIVFKTTSGSGQTITTGTVSVVYSDGTNIKRIV